MKKEEYIKYPTGHGNWSKILISNIKEKDKRECWECEGKKTKPDYDGIPTKCSTCEGRGWVYKEQEWEFSCNCGAETCRACCPDSVELYCECMDDED